MHKSSESVFQDAIHIQTSEILQGLMHAMAQPSQVKVLAPSGDVEVVDAESDLNYIDAPSLAPSPSATQNDTAGTQIHATLPTVLFSILPFLLFLSARCYSCTPLIVSPAISNQCFITAFHCNIASNSCCRILPCLKSCLQDLSCFLEV